MLAPSAFAHSVLIGTQPGNDVVVPESPDEVVLEFNEAVDASLGSLRVIDGQGAQVDSGEVTQPVATEVAVGIDSELAPGTYTVAWRVVSADSDPISGAFVFHVIERGVAANVSIDALTGTSQAVDVLFIDRPVRRLRAAPPGRRRLGRARRRPPVGLLAGPAAAVRDPVGGWPAGWRRSRW